MSDIHADVDTLKLPRIAITYCTKCRWMLRAAYFAQELLSTFDTKIGEVSLLPTTGGIFEVNLTLVDDVQGSENTGKVQTKTMLLWDFKSKRCFPETKILKQLVRNHIDPDRNLGHSDTASKSQETPQSAGIRENDDLQVESKTDGSSTCVDCQ